MGMWSARSLGPRVGDQREGVRRAARPVHVACAHGVRGDVCGLRHLNLADEMEHPQPVAPAHRSGPGCIQHSLVPDLRGRDLQGRHLLACCACVVHQGTHDRTAAAGRLRRLPLRCCAVSGTDIANMVFSSTAKTGVTWTGLAWFGLLPPVACLSLRESVGG